MGQSRVLPVLHEGARIAVPSRYEVGDSSKEKAHRLQSWQDRGPWAARQFPAYICAQPLGYPPQHWGWAAPSLKMSAPLLLVRAEEPAPVRTPRKLSPPDNISPQTASPKKDLDDSKHRPVTMPLNEEILPPDQGAPSGVGPSPETTSYRGGTHKESDAADGQVE